MRSGTPPIGIGDLDLDEPTAHMRGQIVRTI
jgi:hypothetical protein